MITSVVSAFLDKGSEPGPGSHRPGFFFIEDTFYNEHREGGASSVDYSSTIIEWQRAREAGDLLVLPWGADI